MLPFALTNTLFGMMRSLETYLGQYRVSTIKAVRLWSIQKISGQSVELRYHDGTE